MTQEEQDKWVFTVFPIGYRFWYLGRELIVSWHKTWRVEQYWEPCICCDYVDNHGIIQHIEFSVQKIELLKTLV